MNKAEKIWDAEGFKLKGKSKSKWLAYHMGMRLAVFDNWLRTQMMNSKDLIVIHIGCGMDSRVERVGTGNHPWYDVDFPEVIRERNRYYYESDDDPKQLEGNTGISFVKEHEMTPDSLINGEKIIFSESILYSPPKIIFKIASVFSAI